MATQQVPEAQTKIQYAKKHNIHHLFELLAHRVLDRRPENVFGFLREQIDEIEAVEKRRATYDPTAVQHGERSSEKAGKQKVTIGVFGLDNAGKTSLIACVGGEATKNVTPTVGFTPTNLETAEHQVCIFDLGGGATFRGIWPHYYHDCHGVMYVIDASDDKRLKESADSFKALVHHEYIRGKPIVIFCNKRDLATEEALSRVIGVEGLDIANVVGKDTPTKIVACCAVKDADPGVDEGSDWLMQAVTTNYSALSALVAGQSEAVKKAKRERLEAQRRRVEAERSSQN